MLRIWPWILILLMTSSPVSALVITKVAVELNGSKECFWEVESYQSMLENHVTEHHGVGVNIKRRPLVTIYIKVFTTQVNTVEKGPVCIGHVVSKLVTHGDDGCPLMEWDVREMMFDTEAPTAPIVIAKILKDHTDGVVKLIRTFQSR